jgi:hypothetical protein
METKEKNAEVITPTEAELRELGLNAAADKMKRAREQARKLRIAFEHFRVVTPEQVQRFQEELWSERHTDPYTYGLYYKTMRFTALEIYQDVPPAEVLQKIREARELKCFDRFEVLTLEAQEVTPDPVIFGRIEGDDNRYFVAQWDDDVRIEQILREDEG